MKIQKTKRMVKSPVPNETAIEKTMKTKKIQLRNGYVAVPEEYTILFETLNGKSDYAAVITGFLDGRLHVYVCFSDRHIRGCGAEEEEEILKTCSRHDETAAAIYRTDPDNGFHVFEIAEIPSEKYITKDNPAGIVRPTDLRRNYND